MRWSRLNNIILWWTNITMDAGIRCFWNHWQYPLFRLAIADLAILLWTIFFLKLKIFSRKTGWTLLESLSKNQMARGVNYFSITRKKSTASRNRISLKQL